MTWSRAGSWARCVVVLATSLAAVACSGTPTTEPASESAPGSSSAAPSGTVLEGRIVGDADHSGYTVEVPDGWSTEDGGFMVQRGPSVLGLSVWDVEIVPAHPCRWRGIVNDAGSTVDDLVDLLVSQPLRDPTEPVDVTLAGHAGQYLELSVPDGWVVTGDGEFEGCDSGGDGFADFVSWWGRDSGERYQQVAGQVDRIWVLDVDGRTLLVDATYSPDVSAADLEELDQVVGSLRFAEA